MNHVVLALFMMSSARICRGNGAGARSTPTDFPRNPNSPSYQGPKPLPQRSEPVLFTSNWPGELNSGNKRKIERAHRQRGEKRGFRSFDHYEDERSLDEQQPPLHGPLWPQVEPYSLAWVKEGRMRARELSARLLASTDRGLAVVQGAASHAINTTNRLIGQREPSLYGQSLHSQDPALFLAAFNKPKPQSLTISRFGFASLRASQRLARQMKLSRQEALFGLQHVDVQATPLASACPFKSEAPFNRPCPAYSALYRTLDGSCNNKQRSQQGAALRPFARFLPPDYSDGIEELRVAVSGAALPSARKVSTLVHRPVSRPSRRITMMVMQWGQFLDHDLTATAQSRGFNLSVPRCCDERTGLPLAEEDRHPDCLPVPISPGDPFYASHNQSCMEFLRSSPAPQPNCALGPRDQINQVTTYLDASNVYGSDDHEMAQLRLWEGGMLRYKPVRFRKPLLPPLETFQEGECRENSRNLHCFRSGDMRVNEQPALASLHTVWLREHNRIAARLADLNPHWNDDRLFFETRKIVVAMMQKITYGEWLPVVLGREVMKIFGLPVQRKGFYRGYSPAVDATMTNAVAAAAFRFGHSLVQESLPRCDKRGRRFSFNIKLHQELTNPANMHNFGSVDRLMLGMAFEKSQTRDVYMTEELTQRLFMTNSRRFGLDLASINIQRGRDHGLPAYSVWRERCGLSVAPSFDALRDSMDPDTVDRMRAAYKSALDIDLFTGGLGEKRVSHGLVGPTFACILAQQFINLRRGDRFWFENGGQESSLSLRQLAEVRKATVSRVLCDNLDDIDDIQPSVFRPPTPGGWNARTPCSSLQEMDLSAWRDSPRDTSFHYAPSVDLPGAPSPQDSVEPEPSVEEPSIYTDPISKKDSEVFFLEGDEELKEEEADALISDGFSSELPEPFEEISSDEAVQDTSKKSIQGKTNNEDVSRFRMGIFGERMEALEKEMRAEEVQDFGDILEQAYGNTLFYGGNRP